MQQLNKRRRTMGHHKPYDAEIEFLEGDGEAYILTNLIISDLDNDFYVEVELSNSTFGTIYGAYNGDAERSYYFSLVEKYSILTNGGCYNDSSSKFDFKNLLSNIPTRYRVYILRDGTYSFNEHSGSILNTTSRSNTKRTLNLYCVISGNGIGRICACKIYSFKWVKGDDTILDLIPVRIGDEGFMYNKVDGKLFGNAGTGRFILGNDV